MQNERNSVLLDNVGVNYQLAVFQDLLRKRHDKKREDYYKSYFN